MDPEPDILPTCDKGAKRSGPVSSAGLWKGVGAFDSALAYRPQGEGIRQGPDGLFWLNTRRPLDSIGAMKCRLADTGPIPH